MNTNKINILKSLDKINTIINNKNDYGYLSTLSNNKLTKGFPYGSIVSFVFDKEKNLYFVFKIINHTKNLANSSKPLYVLQVISIIYKISFYNNWKYIKTR